MASDWAEYLPEKTKNKSIASRRRRRFMAKLWNSKLLVGICVALYLVWCLFLLTTGMWLPFLLSFFIILVLPLLAYLAWWLMWKEFNS